MNTETQEPGKEQAGSGNVPQLRCLKGPADMQGRLIPLKVSLTFGAGEDCQVQLPDEAGQLGARQLLFDVQKGTITLIVKPEGATVSVNDQAVTQCQLKDGDVITLAETYEFALNDPATARQAPAPKPQPSSAPKNRSLLLGLALLFASPGAIKVILRGLIAIFIVLIAAMIGLKVQEKRHARQVVGLTQEELKEQLQELNEQVKLAHDFVHTKNLTALAEAINAATHLVDLSGTNCPQELIDSLHEVQQTQTQLFKAYQIAMDQARSFYRSGNWDGATAAIMAASAADSSAEEPRQLLTQLQGKRREVAMNQLRQGETMLRSGDSAQALAYAQTAVGEYQALGERQTASMQRASVLVKVASDVVQAKVLYDSALAAVRTGQSAGALKQLSQIDRIFNEVVELCRTNVALNELLPNFMRQTAPQANLWIQQLQKLKDLQAQATELETQGKLGEAHQAYQEMLAFAGTVDTTFFGKNEANWCANTATAALARLASATRAAAATPTPAIAPDILQQAQKLLDQAAIQVSLGNSARARELYQKVGQLLPAGHPMLSRIPPWVYETAGPPAAATQP